MKLEAYLFFPGNTEEAMTFYRGVLGGELSITRRGDVDPTAPVADRQLGADQAPEIDAKWPFRRSEFNRMPSQNVLIWRGSSTQKAGWQRTRQAAGRIGSQ